MVASMKAETRSWIRDIITECKIDVFMFDLMEGENLARRRWKDNIKMELQNVGWGMDWIDLAQDRNRWRIVVNTVMNIRIP